jgi:hypothetical protein
MPILCRLDTCPDTETCLTEFTLAYETITWNHLILSLDFWAFEDYCRVWTVEPLIC